MNKKLLVLFIIVLDVCEYDKDIYILRTYKKDKTFQ